MLHRLHHVRKAATKAAVVAGSALLLGACLNITPHRYDAAHVPTSITVSNANGSQCPNPVDGPARQVQVFIDDVAAGDPATPDATGNWTATIPAPGAIGSYHVTASCQDPETSSGSDITDSFDNEVVVEPVFAPAVAPRTYKPSTAPAHVTFSGSWCINGEQVSTPTSTSTTLPPDAPTNPVVTVVFNGTTKTLTSDTNQPFSDTWTLDFDAPATAGSYTAQVTCKWYSVSNSGPESGTKSSDLTVDVTGELVVTPAAPKTTDAVSVANKAGSECQGGSVDLVVDSTHTTVTPGASGDWTSNLGLLGVGHHVVSGTCLDPAPSAAHLGIVAAPVVRFAYDPVGFDVVAPVTTTASTAPAAVQAVAAQPVVATPRFTG